MSSPSFYFETNRIDRDNNYSYYFTKPLFSLSLCNPKDIVSFFQEIEKLRKKYYLSGFFSYELAYLLEDLSFPSFIERDIDFPYAFFSVYKSPSIYDNSRKCFIQGDDVVSKSFGADYRISNFKWNVTDKEYINTVSSIKDAISRGLVYQVNYTTKYHFDFEGSPFALYLSLKERQSVSYNVFAYFDDYHIISISPELFFSLDKDRIKMKPMKGTMKRGLTLEEDLYFAKKLESDVKNRSENVMIVDLLRNDLGIISKCSSVNVTKLFAIEKYESLYQLTSSIESSLKPVSFYEIIKALFPSGSITGAPKISSMQFISSIEREQRRIYTGALGFLTPYGGACFNVAIRTLLIRKGKGELGIGGGIVYDSKEEEERKECILKARFLIDKSFAFPRSFSLIESIKFFRDYENIALHLDRLGNSARYFDFIYDRKDLDKRLAIKKDKYKSSDKVYKVRILLNREGRFDISFAEYIYTYSSYKLAISAIRTKSDNVFLFHKTTNRDMYDKELKEARRNGYFDIIFFNERDELTEGAISSIYLKRDGILYTPPISCGLLSGIERGILVGSSQVREKVIRKEELYSFTSIYISNALIGFTKARIDFSK